MSSAGCPRSRNRPAGAPSAPSAPSAPGARGTPSASGARGVSGALGALLVLTGLAALIILGASCHKPPVYKVIAAKEGYTHIVSQGETLDSIAVKYYGDARLGQAIGEYNKLDPLKPLEPGQSLLVPFDATELESITRTNEGNVSYNRGTMLARTGQYAEAAPYLEKAVATDPANADAWFNLGVTYSKLGQDERALGVLQRLTGAMPKNEVYQYTYGSVLRKLDRKKDALKAFKRAVELKADYQDAQYALALTYEDIGKRKQARKAWERYLALDKDSAWSEEARIHLDKLQSDH